MKKSQSLDKSNFRRQGFLLALGLRAEFIPAGEVCWWLSLWYLGHEVAERDLAAVIDHGEINAGAPPAFPL